MHDQDSLHKNCTQPVAQEDPRPGAIRRQGRIPGHIQESIEVFNLNLTAWASLLHPI